MNNWPRFYIRNLRRPAAFCLLLAVLTLLSAFAGIGLGAVALSPGEVLQALFGKVGGPHKYDVHLQTAFRRRGATAPPPPLLAGR